MKECLLTSHGKYDGITYAAAVMRAVAIITVATCQLFFAIIMPDEAISVILSLLRLRTIRT